MTPEKVWVHLVSVLDQDNGGKHYFSVPQLKKAMQPIRSLQCAGYFGDDPDNLDGSFWQMAAGEESDRAKFFARSPDAFKALDELLNEIFDPGPANNLPRWLVIGYGETEWPEKTVCATRDEVREAVCVMTYGSVKDADVDAIEVHMESFDDPDCWNGMGINSDIQFEIGGITFVRLLPEFEYPESVNKSPQPPIEIDRPLESSDENDGVRL